MSARDGVDREGPVAVATVVGLHGSAPRPLGTRMVVAADGAVTGAVSGGCVEADVVRCAQEALADGGAARLRSYGVAEDELLDVGLPCGGELDVLVTVEAATAVRARATLGAGSARVVRFTALDPGDLGSVTDVDEAVAGPGRGWQSALADDVLRAGRPVLVRGPDGQRALAEPLGGAPLLVVVGADDLAEALCAAARALGWRTAVLDPRAAAATTARVPSADALHVGWPDADLPPLGLTGRDAVIVNTHQPHLDRAAITGALATPAGYVGALGSRRNAAGRLERLREAGLPDHALLRVHAPCGLDLGAAGPAETALSILAEVLATRNARGGGPLREAATPIHPRVRELSHPDAGRPLADRGRGAGR